LVEVALVETELVTDRAVEVEFVMLAFVPDSRDAKKLVVVA
jgi:hypothetical protein